MLVQMNIFDYLTPIRSELLYQRNDPDDVRLGETVSISRESYEKAQIVLLGCPQDEGVRRNKGRVGASEAPTEIRRSLYKLTTGTLTDLNLLDIGDTIIQSSLEQTHDVHQQIVEHLLYDGKMMIVLGGGNDCSYPDCAGVASIASNLLAFNIDAHFDVRADSPRNSGTPYRMLLEAGHIKPENFYEIGYQPFGNSPQYAQYLADKDVNLYSLPSLRASNIEPAQLINGILSDDEHDAIFWGLDMDVVRASDAPGVSALNPTGMFAEEVCDIAYVAGRAKQTRLFEITEVNPTYDIDGRTARLAAVVLYYFLSGITER